MLIIETTAQHNGAHRNQSGHGSILDGWVLVPPELEAEALSYLPFINLDIQDGVLVGVSQGTQIISPEETAAELAAAKVEHIAQSKADLAAYLESHPLQWTDGAYYAITQEKQNQLMGTIAAAQIDGKPPEWNSTGGQCREWDAAELSALAVAIKDRVKALVKYQQAQEIAMNAAETMDELDAIIVDYDSVTA